MFSLLTSFLVAVALLQGPAAKPRPAAPAAAPAAPTPIVWSASRPLTIADFQGRPGPSDRLAALTSAEIKAGAACRDFVFSGTVQATFDPKTSWFRNPTTASPALLKHEQMHFDITEVYARLLRQKLVVFQAKANCNKLQPAFDNLTKGVYTEWSREQNRYDAETNHGLNAAKQDYWEKQTQIKLTQLQAFAVEEPAK
ncbi:MAG TPA: DUF922 domain-containing protein [Hymenobacter sp.]|jgi:hypothetical protein|uniref:DUF922 domain-containing protein n=1 Tax=Hymenobacter sp. TaxID=1898978 RepID=UPI002ED9C3AF